MNVKPLCKAIETKVVSELAAARSQQEKALILTSALYEYGHTVLKYLNALSSTGAATAEYRQGLRDATELMTFLVLPFIGSCSTYKQGITVLEDLGDMCSDESLRKRLVIYSNQVKRRWLEVDPSGLPINPRAAKLRRRQPEPNLFGAAVKWGLTAVGLYLLGHFFLLPSLTSGRNPAAQVQDVKLEGEPPAHNAPQPPPAVAEPQGSAPVPAKDYFSYTDDKGTVHLGNKAEPLGQKVPEESPRQFPPQAQPQSPPQLPQQASLHAPPVNAAPVPAAPPANLTSVARNAAANTLSEMNVFESCRCKNGLAAKGDLKEEVLQKCDQPVTRQVGNNGCREIWLYNFGPNEFMQGICFESGRVKKVLSLDRGY